MADILYPEQTPQGAAATFGTPAAAAPDTTSPATPDEAKKKSKNGGKKGGIGGFLTSPLGEIIGGVGAAALGALTGGLALPALGLGGAALGAGLGGALGGGLEQGIVNKSPLAGVLGAVEGAGVGLGGEALLGGLPALGLTATGAAAPAAAGGAAGAAGAAAPAGAAGAASGLTSAAGADPLAALLGSGAAGGAATAGGGGAAVGSPALAPGFFGAAADPTAAALGGGAATGGGAAPAAGGGGALSELLAGNPGAAAGDVGSWLASHPSLALSAVGPLATLLSPTPSVPGLTGLNRSAKELQAFGGTAVGAEASGTLPPGAEQFVENALHDEQAQIKGTYASLGLSGSTMEAQDLAAASERAAANRFQIASTVTKQGLQALGASGSEFSNLAQLQLAQDQRLQEAIASFSSALGYGQGLQRIPTA